MFSFFKPKKKSQSLELKKKELESGKNIYLKRIYPKKRNRIIKRFQRWYAYKSERYGFRISRRYINRKKYNRNRFRKSERASASNGCFFNNNNEWISASSSQNINKK